MFPGIPEEQKNSWGHLGVVFGPYWGNLGTVLCRFGPVLILGGSGARGESIGSIFGDLQKYTKKITAALTIQGLEQRYG